MSARRAPVPTLRFPRGLAPLLPLAAIFASAPALAQLGAGRPDVISVEVREVPGEDLWQVSYLLPERAAGVEMVRTHNPTRHRTWGLAPEGSAWHRTGDAERICFPRDVRSFAVSFRSDLTRPAGDVAPVVAFADGSRLLLTGNLLVRPLRRCYPGSAPEAAEPLPGSFVHRFELETAAARTVRVGELAAAERLEWRPEPGQETTYAFFGTAPAVTTERAVLLLDAGLPQWLSADVQALLPRLLDHLAGETGLSLPARPLVVVTSDRGREGAAEGRSVASDSSDGVVLLTVGGGWAQASAEARRDWLVGLAREAFRLWNDDLLRPDEESQWLAEASAQTFALRAAVGLGVLSPAGYAAELVARANRCLAELAGAPLLAAPARGASPAWSSCGPVVLFVADRAVERRVPSQGGLGLLFREMFAEARQHGDVYGTGVFLGWLDKLSQDRATVHALQGLVRQGVASGADRFLHGLLQGAGLEVSLVEPAEATAGGEVFRPLLQRALVRCACGTTPAEASGDPDCARFAAGQPLASVDGLDVRQQPAEAYGRLRSAALLARPLRVVAGDDEQPVELLCPRDVLEPTFDSLLRLDPPQP